MQTYKSSTYIHIIDLKNVYTVETKPYIKNKFPKNNSQKKTNSEIQCLLAWKDVMRGRQNKFLETSDLFPNTQCIWAKLLLVGGYNPIWKILLKMRIFPQIGVKIKNIWNQQLYSQYIWPNFTSFHQPRFRTLKWRDFPDPLLHFGGPGRAGFLYNLIKWFI